MSPQVIYSLKRVVILIVISALGIIIESATGILAQAGLNEGFYPIIMVALASALRWFEGLRDSQRASEGRVEQSDVAYSFVAEMADADETDELPAPVRTDNKTVFVGEGAVAQSLEQDFYRPTLSS